MNDQPPPRYFAFVGYMAGTMAVFGFVFGFIVGRWIW